MEKIHRPIKKAFRYVSFPLVLLDYKDNLHYFDSNFNYLCTEKEGGKMPLAYRFPAPDTKEVIDIIKTPVVIELPFISCGWSDSYRLIVVDAGNKMHFFDDNGIYQGFTDNGNKKFNFPKLILN